MGDKNDDSEYEAQYLLAVRVNLIMEKAVQHRKRGFSTRRAL